MEAVDVTVAELSVSHSPGDVTMTPPSICIN